MAPQQEVQEEFSKIFEELGNSLDITEIQYDNVVNHYNAVGKYLSALGSELAPYKPEILPQGSFMLGTMIKPVHDDDELDIDLVCKLEGKRPEWTQYDVKKIVGDRLSNSGVYGPMLDEEGRRCWTLNYAEKTRFHLDILPAIVGVDYKIILEKALSNAEVNQIGELVISITDKETNNYYTEIRPENWLRSNPFGYAKWFEDRANIGLIKALDIRESVKPVPVYRKVKLPLIRVVQILKRHRDIMFEGDEDKPISIIITTLAANAYARESNLLNALVNVVNGMENYVQERYDTVKGKRVKWISNPINGAENFADKWGDYPNKERNFFIWLSKIKQDINAVLQERSYRIQAALEQPFGKSIITETFNRYGESKRLLRENGELRMAAKTALLGSSGTVVKNHNFFGNGQ